MYARFIVGQKPLTSLPDMGMTQSRIMRRLRIKCYPLESWVYLNKKNGKHFESWVDLNQNLGIHLNHELLLSQFLESWLSHELNRLKSPRYGLSHELSQMNLSKKSFEPEAQKGPTKSTLGWKVLKGHTKSTVKLDVQKRSYENGNE